MIAARAFFSTSTRRARKKREWELGRAGEDNFPQITLTEPELWSSSPREQLSGIVSRWPRVLGQFPPPAASASRGLKGFLSFFLSLFLYLSISFFFFFPFLPTEQRVSNAIRGRTVFAMGERECERERERDVRDTHGFFVDADVDLWWKKVSRKGMRVWLNWKETPIFTRNFLSTVVFFTCTNSKR